MNEEQLKFVCKGDEAAMAFCRSWVAVCHLLDDIEDGDEPVTDERVIGAQVGFFVEVAGNLFFQKFKPQLLSLVVVSFNAWLDANGMEKSADENVNRAADVVKGWYHEVVFYCGFLCGGWGHFREVTRRYRAYDFDFAERSSKFKVQSSKDAPGRQSVKLDGFTGTETCKVCGKDTAGFSLTSIAAGAPVCPNCLEAWRKMQVAESATRAACVHCGQVNELTAVKCGACGRIAWEPKTPNAKVVLATDETRMKHGLGNAEQCGGCLGIVVRGLDFCEYRFENGRIPFHARCQAKVDELLAAGHWFGWTKANRLNGEEIAEGK